jgi:ATP-dependent DNA ligase
LASYKLDGFGHVIVKDSANVRLYSRRGAKSRRQANLATYTAVLDADLIHVGVDGRADFYALSRQMPG